MGGSRPNVKDLFTRAMLCTALSLPSCGVRPSICPSHAGIVSKGKNYLKTFLTDQSPHHSSFDPLRRYPIPRGTHSAGALNTRGVGKFAISTKIAVYLRKSETVRDRLMVAR